MKHNKSSKQQMEDQMAMNEAIAKAVVEVTQVAIQTLSEVQNQRSEDQRVPKLGSPVLKQPQFNWEATDKYTEWKAFRLEVRNVLSMYNAQEQEKIAMEKNWLCRKGLHYLETHKVVEGCTNTNTAGIIKQKSNGQNQSTKLINYFYSSKDPEGDKRQSNDMKQKIHDTYGNGFNGIGCFKGTFSLQLKPDSKPYQAPPRHMAYALQKPFKEELKQLQELDIIIPLGVDEMAEWCNSFVVVPKANGNVRLSLDPE